MSLEKIINPDSDKLFEEAADKVFSALAGGDGPNRIVAVPGGRSIVGMLNCLANNAQQLSKDQWSRLQFFILDERLVPLDDPESNYRLVSELFFNPVIENGLLRSEQVHPFHPKPELADGGVSVYQEELRALGSKFDVVFLGVGEDAHVGALFPNHHSIENTSEFFFTMNDSPKPPPARMTCSRRLIEQSDVAIALFLGEAKREALARYADESLSVEQCPVKLLNSARQGYILTDQNIG